MRIFLLFLSLTSAVWANVTVSTDYASQYVFRGAQVGDAAIQPNVNVELGNAYLNAWGNLPLQSGEVRETDLTVGGSLGSFDGGLTAYTYSEGQTTWEPYLGYSVGGDLLKGSLYAFRDTTLRTTTFEAKVVATRECTARAAVAFEAAVGNSRGRDLASYTYWSAGPVFRYTVGKLTTSAAVQYASSTDRELKRDLWVGRVGLSYAF